MGDTPEMIGKYKILSVVAQGGMGTVYKAEHPSLKRQIIIKKLTIRGNPAVRERFKREAQILLDLHSPYIVHMYDYFTEGPYHYIALEFVDGMSLDKLIQKQTALPVEIALLVFLDACYALKYAHKKGIVHRDIKPGNILISKNAAVKLADFGIAVSDKESEDTLTQSGVTLGTPSYMPPEQFTDSKTVDCRADIYAMGVMLYETVTGTKPFPGSLSAGTLAQIQKGKYIAPEKIDASIPRTVSRLIKKMIRSNPARRYQTIEPVIAIVKRYLKEYDARLLRENLARMILSGAKPFECPQFVPRKHTLRTVLLCAAAAGIAVIGAAAAWNAGLVHKYLLRSYYTPVTVTVTLPDTASAEADLPIRAFFFKNDNDRIPEVAGSRRVLTLADVVEDDIPAAASELKRYRSKPVYVRPGNYRIKVAAGPYVWWQSLPVEKEAVSASLDLQKYAVRSISVHPIVFEAASGKRISGEPDVSVLYGAKWVPLADMDPAKLKTGNVWKFKISAAGYSEEIFSLRIDWYQDELFITAALDKRE
ncbi:serine/threonine protein kinase [Treponema brennaborense]|uniref:non-specific serine/threonine protein kinase n=1 Tax=Treponema brennaborense (strain DSM 12168 / CIP 105900 / DD5/3) TaxID=906968 RepID=F4LP93_TREBD|nr:serine/threonine-protein kinase [Treponema brennaborense]AEE16955.1 serine/threonine protein kinase [Treponema brennaborense DSM 12168]